MIIEGKMKGLLVLLQAEVQLAGESALRFGL
jgi:hypothetical protein